MISTRDIESAYHNAFGTRKRCRRSFGPGWRRIEIGNEMVQWDPSEQHEQDAMGDLLRYIAQTKLGRVA